MRRQAEVEVGGPHKIECKYCLRKVSIPKVQWEVWICCCKAGEKVFFKGSYIALSGINFMKVRWDQLILYVVCAKVSL